MTGRVLVMILMIVTTVAAGGCASDPTRGYAAEGTFRAGINSVAIPIIANDTFVRDIEFDLTAALISEIEARTPYTVTAEARADSILEGRIRKVELNQLSKSRTTGLSEEAIVGVTIDFQWRDLRTDQTIVAREEFAGHGLFVPSTPSSERIELGRIAAVQQLARDIVDELRGDW